MERDLEALRRRAFSRAGTPEDLRRLAAAQASAPAPGPIPPTDPGPARRPDPEPVEEPVAELPPTRRRRWPVALAAAALGVAVGIPTGLALAPDAPPPGRYSTEDSLRIFDRPGPVPPADVPPLGFTSPRAEVRYLGAWAALEVYVSREVLDTGDAQICLYLVEPSGNGGATCTTEPEFRAAGVWLHMGEVAIGWGPHGEELWVPPPLGAG